MADLTSLTDEIQSLLSDDATIFTDALIAEAVRQTLRIINAKPRYRRIGTVTLTSDSRELSTATLTQPATVQAVWLPYLVTDVRPNWRAFESWPTNLINITDGDPPSTGDVARIWYVTPHTLSGLDAAAATTLDDAGTAALVAGSAAAAIEARIRTVSEQFKIDPGTVKALTTLRDRLQHSFDTWLDHLQNRAAGAFGTWK